ncbi:MAG TPA: hypothetical protein VKB12_10455, partial [Pyrinomonadaceae bacterium]|nr:hypothetical protein [Pyrinomonadaceae bacterium]
MRKTNPQPTSKTAGANARRLFLSNRRGRIAALFILAIALTAASVATMSFAQSKRRARRAPAEAEKLVRAQRPEMPGRSEREREEERARERGGASKRERDRDNQEGRALSGPARLVDAESRKPVSLKPTERKLNRAHSFDGDLRELPFVPSAKKRERFEREMPAPPPALLTKDGAATSQVDTGTPASEIQGPSAPVPGPIITFPGLDFAGWGAGHPPDTVGDVGPNHYIQSINSSVAIYDKTTGTRLAAFTLNALMSQGSQGNLCDTNNFGDPVVLYDTFEDRWVITDFAFQLSGQNVINPPGAFQCFAVSRTGDPVAGGWNFYSINTTGGLGDYPKLGVWPDGIYMSV